eukprot:351256-Chlamydomonas_euryale.AAC.2
MPHGVGREQGLRRMVCEVRSTRALAPSISTDPPAHGLKRRAGRTHFPLSPPSQAERQRPPHFEPSCGLHTA